MKTESAFLLGLTLLAPCAVLGVRFVEIQPRGAQATTQALMPSPDVQETDETVAWSSGLDRIWLHASTRTGQRSISSDPNDVPVDPEPVRVVPVQQALPIPELVMTGLYGSGGRSAAMINEQIVRRGAAAAPGWILMQTDPVARTATLEHADGRRLVLSLNED